MSVDSSIPRHDDPSSSAGGRPVALKAGDRVRVYQQIPQRRDAWMTDLEGTVVSYRQAKTGSWFAHSKGDKLWLDRLEIRKDDGEVTICNLDQFSRIEVIESATESDH